MGRAYESSVSISNYSFQFPSSFELCFVRILSFVHRRGEIVVGFIWFFPLFSDGDWSFFELVASIVLTGESMTLDCGGGLVFIVSIRRFGVDLVLVAVKPVSLADLCLVLACQDYRFHFSILPSYFFFRPAIDVVADSSCVKMVFFHLLPNTNVGSILT